MERRRRNVRRERRVSLHLAILTQALLFAAASVGGERCGYSNLVATGGALDD
jgi:hypothetical protein